MKIRLSSEGVTVVSLHDLKDFCKGKKDSHAYNTDSMDAHLGLMAVISDV